MKKLIIFAVFFTIYASFAQENYTIEINGKKMDIQLGKPYEIKVHGKKINFKVDEKEYLLFNEGTFSFEYKNSFKVVKTEEEGILQYMIMDASGSGILIQKYSTFDPVMIKQLLLNEVTKESISYGYEEKKTEYERKLNSGQTINIIKSELTYKGETIYYEIGSFSKKDSGLIFLVINMDPTKSNDLIEHFWKTLKVIDE